MRIIDYLNQGRYLKRVTDQQPAIQGHVNYVIEQLTSGIVDITPTDSSEVVTAYIPVDSNADTFTAATTHAKGAIIGSAFIKMLTKEGVPGIGGFVSSIR